MVHVVLGASPNERRYSYLATESLVLRGYNVVPVGIKKGKIGKIEITQVFPMEEEIHTITMYLSVENQKQYYEKIFANLPKRVIFNPGANNKELEYLLIEKGVKVVNDCTLIMLNQGKY